MSAISLGPVVARLLHTNLRNRPTRWVESPPKKSGAVHYHM